METMSPQKQKHLLFLSYYFPPVQVNAMVRIKNFYEGFLENGFLIFVITGKFPDRVFRDAAVPACIPNIIYIPLVGIRIFLMHFFIKHHALPIPWKNSRVVSLLLSIRNRIPFDLLIGDGGLVYMIRTYFKGRKCIKQHPITHIFSTFSPISDHFVAYLLKKSFPHLHWMADFRDLPLDIKIPCRWNRVLSDLFFKKIIDNVDEIITVSEGLAKELRIYHSRIHIYSGCIAEEHFLPERKRPAAFQLNYTGSIYPGNQQIEPVIKVIQELIEEEKLVGSDLKWTYCGVHSEIFRRWLIPYFREEQMEIRPLLGNEEAKVRQRQAAINLLLTWNTHIQAGILTTKLFEYFEAGRPILIWSHGEYEKEVDDILSLAQKGGYYYLGREKEMKLWIFEQYKCWLLREWACFDPVRIRKEYGIGSRNTLIKKVSGDSPTQKNT